MKVQTDRGGRKWKAEAAKREGEREIGWRSLFLFSGGVFGVVCRFMWVSLSLSPCMCVCIYRTSLCVYAGGQ